MTEIKKTTVEFDYDGSDGTKKKASLVLLKRKEAAEVFHTVLRTMFSSGSDIDNVIRAMEFDNLWLLASKLLRGAVINVHTEITTLEETDYFEDKPDELYILMVQGVMNNWPNFFRPKDGILPDK